MHRATPLSSLSIEVCRLRFEIVISHEPQACDPVHDNDTDDDDDNNTIPK